MKINKALRIRAHHLICILGFKGMGYSEEFIQNMYRLVDMLNKNGEVAVEIIRGPDEICTKCPHLHPDGGCGANNGANPDERDQMVLKKLAAGTNNVFYYNDLLNIMSENIRAEDLEIICRGCRWAKLSHCRDGLINLKNELIKKKY